METGIEKLRLDNIQVFAVYGYIVVEMSRNALLSQEIFLTPTYPSAGLFILFSLYIYIYTYNFFSIHNQNTIILNLMAFCRRIVLSRAYVFYCGFLVTFLFVHTCLLQARYFRR